MAADDTAYLAALHNAKTSHYGDSILTHVAPPNCIWHCHNAPVKTRLLCTICHGHRTFESSHLISFVTKHTHIHLVTQTRRPSIFSQRSFAKLTPPWSLTTTRTLLQKCQIGHQNLYSQKTGNFWSILTKEILHLCFISLQFKLYPWYPLTQWPSRYYLQLSATYSKPHVKYHILNNECSQELNEAFNKYAINFWLVPTTENCANASKHAILKFKNPFISIFSTVDSHNPRLNSLLLQNWLLY